MELAGRHIRKAKPGAVLAAKHTAQVVVDAVLQHIALDHRTGGDDSYNLSFNDALGGSRVLHLLADGHLVAPAHQLGNIAVCAVEGHAAHRRPLLLAAVPTGEHQVQLFAGDLGIIKKHFIKIAQTEKQNHICIILLDLKILLHHGADLCLCHISSVLLSAKNAASDHAARSRFTP